MCVRLCVCVCVCARAWLVRKRERERERLSECVGELVSEDWERDWEIGNTDNTNIVYWHYWFATAAAWERECTERSTLFVSASFDGQSIAVLYKFIERPRKKLPVSAKKRWDKAQFTFRFLATGADAPSPKDPENGALHNFHKFRICIINTRTDVCMNTIIWMEHRMFVCVCVCVCVHHTHIHVGCPTSSFEGQHSQDKT